MANQTRSKLENDVDALFRLPLAEFVGARNALASRLKKEKRVDEGDFVKTLVKPSVSAWAVNQLYWEYRAEFDQLVNTGERLRKLQASGLGGKVADMRAALDKRRDTLTRLSDLAAELLKDAGHNPSLDTIRRVTTTLEAMSAYASLTDGPRPGRLTQDVDPPGFESLAGLVASGAGTRATAPPKVDHAATSVGPKIASVNERRQLQEERQARIAAAKVSFKEAKSVLSEVRIRAQRTEAAQKRANAEAKEAEKQRREAEERLKKAQAAADESTRRARSVAEEAEEAAQELEDAERNLEKTSRDLEKLVSN